MDNYIVINGKRAELTPEQLKALGIETKTSQFQLDEQEKYYFITSFGSVTETNTCLSRKERHNNANYCTDKTIMEQRALHETLNRLLWRYSMEHKSETHQKSETGADVFYSITHWTPDHWSERDGFYVEARCRGFGLEPYFDTKEIAENAIEEIVKPFMKEHPNFRI